MKKLTEEQIKKLETLPVRLNEVEFDMPEMPDDSDPDEPVICKIDMIRTGKFVRESWFGNYLLNIDEPLFDKFIENFKNNVIKRGVPLDIDHKKDAAYGWLKDLTKEYRTVMGKQQCYLVGSFEMNRLGIDMVKNRIRNLFSLEFSFNYKDNEVDGSFVVPTGEDVPVGAMKTYGPTILGGALTNRPFIPDLGTIKCSSEFNQIEGLPNELKNQLKDHTFMFNVEKMTVEDADLSVRSEKPVVNKEGSKVNPYSILLNFKTINKPEKRNTQMSALQKLLANLKENLSKVDPNSQEFTEIKSQIVETETELAQLADSVKAKDEALKLSAEKISELTTRMVNNENTLSKLKVELEEEGERRRQSDIEKFTSSLSRRGIPKPAISKIKNILIFNKNEKAIVELKLDGDKVKPLTLRGVIEEVLSYLPESAMVPMGEKFSFSGTDNAEKETELSHEDAEEEFFKKNEAAIKRGTEKGRKAVAPQNRIQE